MQNDYQIDDIEHDIPEWIESIDFIHHAYGEEGVRRILDALHNHIPSLGAQASSAALNTPYVNTIPPLAQAQYPGDIELEKKIENIIRWNAMAMVLQAQDQGTGVGGHIATYSSIATVLEVGFNHFFHGADDGDTDVVMPQPHAAPGIYARAYLEGRISKQQLTNYRRELGDGGGLSSYPHPRSMPEFWQLPNASMGLSTPAAIYQARFAKYLENRGLKPASKRKVWCFIGDGESDEPEVLGTINIAAREKLDNLILVVNCNLQRLDGPVRGNGKIIQELERTFRGADWNVIKVIWGSGWDSLLAQDVNGVLRKRMETCVDGDYQRYSILDGNVQREHWVEGSPELEKLMNTLTDEEVNDIKRGGQDPKKIYAAFAKAMQSQGKPTVILVKTVKGDGLGESAQGQNTAHQKKNFSTDERIRLARSHGIPLSDEQAAAAEFYKPDDSSPELQYLQTKRQELNGYVPSRKVDCPSIPTPSLDNFQDLIKGSGERKMSTTMVMVRILSKLLKDKDIGQYIVPIVPDEARTFGMDGLFKAAGIYSCDGQNYTAVDADSLMHYREATNGQILQEGICETGAIASFMAAGSAYAMHALPMIPFYIFYSMFGFQRVGDMIWSCGDMQCRGFLIGGTAGRTTLNGEGLQHQDGHSHLLANTVPNLISYDPAFAYELTIIIREGIRRMYTEQEDVFYYITVYNENHLMPAMPDNAALSKTACAEISLEQSILKGGYCFKRSSKNSGAQIHLLSSGSIMQQALSAGEKLEQVGYRVNIWSITSFTELEREAIACERWNRNNLDKVEKKSYIKKLFNHQSGQFIAVTDYMKSLPGSIAKWMQDEYTILGTDGYGLSEARPSLRDHFEVSDNAIILAALAQEYRQKRLSKLDLEQHKTTLNL